MARLNWEARNRREVNTPAGPDERYAMLAPKTVAMTARFGGTCTRCQRPFLRGDLIRWAPHRRTATHIECKAGVVQPPRDEIAAAVRTTRDIAAAARRLGMHPKGLETRRAFEKYRR